MRKIIRMWEDFWSWATDHKLLSASLFTIALLTPVSVILAKSFVSRSAVERINTINLSGEDESLVKLVDSKTTGQQIVESLNNQPVIGVMISNSSDARPQSGLNGADIVFEAIAEGGITRYLALFHDQDTASIGPVRSVRPYYVDWALTFDSFIAHVGGSTEGLARVKSDLPDKDIDEFRFGRSIFSRISSRSAPHNTYTSTDKLLKAVSQIGLKQSEFEPFKRRDPTPVTTPTTTSISIPYSSAPYNTEWTYNPNNNSYLRQIGGKKHTDAGSKSQVEFDVVVVLRTTYNSFFRAGTTYSDPVTSGSGDVVVFQNGEAIGGRWKKSSKSSMYEFTTETGETLAINKGSVWFAIQPKTKKLSYE